MRPALRVSNARGGARGRTLTPRDESSPRRPIVARGCEGAFPGERYTALVTNETNTGDAFALGTAFFEDCKTVNEFMREKVRPLVQRFADQGQEHGTVHGAFLRAHAWLGTFEKLNQPSDFQAVIAGTRAVFEITVDLALLHYDRANLPVAKMVAWERSAKLKAAERTRRCYENRQLPEHLHERVAFIDRESTRIQEERARVWPGRSPTSHPDRWTARPLEADAMAADGFGPFGFRDFYDDRFAQLCWGTHGSSIAIVRNISPEHFPTLAAMAFRDVAGFGVLASELVLRYFGVFDAIAEAKFRLLGDERKKWRGIGFATQKGYLPK